MGGPGSGRHRGSGKAVYVKGSNKVGANGKMPKSVDTRIKGGKREKGTIMQQGSFTYLVKGPRAAQKASSKGRRTATNLSRYGRVSR